MKKEFDSKDNPPDDLTRREWVLRLGEMAALVGVSGLVPNVEALQGLPHPARFSQGGSPNASTTQIKLPPGLYGPSEEHLVHALATAKFTPPHGSETDYIDSKAPYRVQFFSPEEFRIITRFVEILLGKVDRDSLTQTTHWLDLYLQSSAGVRDAAQHLDPLHRILAVEFFGENSVRELETFDPATIFYSGLKSLHDIAIVRYRKPFLDLTPAEQTNLVESTATTAPDSASKKFFEVLRRESMRGYYTSAKGLEDLDYQGNAFYTECPGCQGKS